MSAQKLQNALISLVLVGNKTSRVAEESFLTTSDVYEGLLRLPTFY